MLKSRKILLISEPGNAGVKRHVLDILRCAFDDPRSNYEMALAYSLERSDNVYPEELEALKAQGVETVRFFSSNKMQPLRDLFSILRMACFIHRWKPDLIHCHSSKAGFLGRLIAKILAPSCPVLFTPNVISVNFSKSYFLPEYLLAQLTDQVVAASASEAKDLKDLGLFRNKPITPVPLCVTPQIPNELAASDRSPDRIRAVGCGRICRQKNSFLFFQLAELAADKNLPVDFVWIGDYGDNEESRLCQQLVARHQNLSLEVTGWLSDPDSVIKSADVFLMLSRYESFGYVTADAMALGLPVIGTSVSGTVDLVVDGETGFLVDAQLPELSNRLELLATDPSLRNSMGESGRIRIQKDYPLSRMWKELSELYEQWSSVS